MQRPDGTKKQSAQRGRPALRLLSTAIGYITIGFGSVVGGSGCDAVGVGLLLSAEAIVLAGAALLSTHWIMSSFHALSVVK